MNRLVAEGDPPGDTYCMRDVWIGFLLYMNNWHDKLLVITV